MTDSLRTRYVLETVQHFPKVPLLGQGPQLGKPLQEPQWPKDQEDFSILRPRRRVLLGDLE